MKAMGFNSRIYIELKLILKPNYTYCKQYKLGF